tara:strand:+ start:236 stop:514 length:279 start_codon:yes stop_codon:yes gene_type:complete
MAQTEKTFINGLFIREKEFDWGTILSVDIDVNKVTKQLNELKNEKGFVKLDLKKRQNKSEQGLTHYAELNTFIPKSNIQSNQQASNNDDLPF